MNLIALIPARMGSMRIPLKNFKPLNGKSLLCYTIEAALKVEALEKIIVSTDYPSAIEIIEGYKDPRLVFSWRIKEFSLNTSPDFQWIRYTFDNIGWGVCTHYMILRPTSPFRTAETINRAIVEHKDMNYEPEISLKSVQLVKEYPQKMWIPSEAAKMVCIPYEHMRIQSKPASFEEQSANFASIYIQNGCIDICPLSIIKEWGNRYIGNYIYPFLTEGFEGVDINTKDDWGYAEFLMKGKNNAN